MIDLETDTTPYTLCIPRSILSSSDFTEEFYLHSQGTMLKLILNFDLKIYFARFTKDIHEQTRRHSNKEEGSSFAIEHSRSSNVFSMRPTLSKSKKVNGLDLVRDALTEEEMSFFQEKVLKYSAVTLN